MISPSNFKSLHDLSVMVKTWIVVIFQEKKNIIIERGHEGVLGVSIYILFLG